MAGRPGIARQRGAAPFLRAPALDGHARPRHAALRSPKAAQELTLPRPVPVARELALRPLVPRAAQRRRQFLLQQLLDEPAHPLPDARLNRVKPSLPGKQRRAVRLRPRAILFHGVVSTGARTPEMAR